HQGYDYKAYLLGLYTKSYFKSEADFAQQLLQQLAQVDSEKLNETDAISAKLLQFVLQDKIDYYEFGFYLNPLLSDTGFHTNLTYRVKPLTNYQQVKAYLTLLNAIPDFVDQHLENLREG